jgi:hypothetical protein
MSYDRDAAMDEWAEQREQEILDEYYEQQNNEYNECMRELEMAELSEDEAAKPKYQKDDEYYETEAALDLKAELEYKEQLKKYYDELELQQMIESEEKQLDSIVNDYYDKIHLDEKKV